MTTSGARPEEILWRPPMGSAGHTRRDAPTTPRPARQLGQAVPCYFGSGARFNISEGSWLLGVQRLSVVSKQAVLVFTYAARGVVRAGCLSMLDLTRARGLRSILPMGSCRLEHAKFLWPCRMIIGAACAPYPCRLKPDSGLPNASCLSSGGTTCKSIK